MSEVAKRPGAVANPATGEVIDLSGPTDLLAEYLDDLRNLDRELRVVKDRIAAEITARLDVENRRSAEVGGWVVETQAPTVWETDALHLLDGLLNLAALDDAPLSADAAQQAVRVVESLKVDRRKLKSLRNHPDERVRGVVAEFDREVPNPARRVSVKRA